MTTFDGKPQADFEPSIAHEAGSCLFMVVSAHPVLLKIHTTKLKQ